MGTRGNPGRLTTAPTASPVASIPKKQIRFSWHAADDAPATLVDIRMRSVDGGTELTIVHDHLPASADLEALRSRWETTLDNLIAAS